MGYRIGELERDQYTILPFNFDELISEDNTVRVIDAYVDKLDMKELKFKYAQTSTRGNKAYNPKQMLKLTCMDITTEYVHLEN